MNNQVSIQEYIEQLQACTRLVAEHLPENTTNSSYKSVFQTASAHIHAINHNLAEYGEAASTKIPNHKIITYAHTAVVASTALMGAAEVAQHQHSEQPLRKLRALTLAANMLLEEVRENISKTSQ
jgi:hypothetical protein